MSPWISLRHIAANLAPRVQNSRLLLPCVQVNRRHVSAAPLTFDVSLQGIGGKRFAVVRLGHHAPVRADASPFLGKQDSAEQVRLHDEPVKAAHVGRRIDAAKIDGGHGASLAIA